MPDRAPDERAPDLQRAPLPALGRGRGRLRSPPAGPAPGVPALGDSPGLAGPGAGTNLALLLRLAVRGERPRLPAVGDLQRPLRPRFHAHPLPAARLRPL